MIPRACKLLLVFAVALFYSLIVLNNVTDYDSNFQLVRHVLMMDSTLPSNHLMWRALNDRAWHVAFYVTIIAWEIVVMVLCWWAGVRLARTLSASAEVFDKATYVAVAALTLAMLQWLVAFLIVGGEWFLMWQSKTWNGQDAAFRMFTVCGIVLLLVVQPERDSR